MHPRTRHRAEKYVLGAAFALFAAVSTVAAGHFSAEDDHHVIADPRTGLALFGYDPVAYHSDRVAIAGSKDFELARDGLIWRFRSSANRAAFESDPVAYIPTFGGYDGASVSEGVLAKGDPETFVIASGKVVFFRTTINRDRFAAESEVRQRARQSWPQVVRQKAAH